MLLLALEQIYSDWLSILTCKVVCCAPCSPQKSSHQILKHTGVFSFVLKPELESVLLLFIIYPVYLLFLKAYYYFILNSL